MLKARQAFLFLYMIGVFECGVVKSRPILDLDVASSILYVIFVLGL